MNRHINNFLNRPYKYTLINVFLIDFMNRHPNITT